MRVFHRLSRQLLFTKNSSTISCGDVIGAFTSLAINDREKQKVKPRSDRK